MATYSGQVIIGPMSGGTSLAVEASMSESHTFSIELTDFPVDEGADITDHRRVKPQELRIEGVNSDTPILTQVELDAIGYNGDNPGIVDGAYRFFLNLRDSGQLLSIATKKRSYDNMMLMSLTVPDGPGLEGILNWTATFKEIRIVQNRSVIIQVPRTPAGAQLKNNGKQPCPTATQGQTNQSVAKKISNVALPAVKQLFSALSP